MSVPLPFEIKLDKPRVLKKQKKFFIWLMIFTVASVLLLAGSIISGVFGVVWLLTAFGFLMLGALFGVILLGVRWWLIRKVTRGVRTVVKLSTDGLTLFNTFLPSSTILGIVGVYPTLKKTKRAELWVGRNVEVKKVPLGAVMVQQLGTTTVTLYDLSVFLTKDEVESVRVAVADWVQLVGVDYVIPEPSRINSQVSLLLHSS